MGSGSPQSIRTTTTTAAAALPIRALAFSHDNRTLATAGDDRSLMMWDLSGKRGLARVITRDLPTEAITLWAKALYRRFGGPIAVCLEIAKGPLVHALQRHEFIVLFPVNPATLAKYREAFVPSRAKDDPTDAQIALELLLRHRDKLQPLQPQSADMRTLADELRAYLLPQRDPDAAMHMADLVVEGLGAALVCLQRQIGRAHV